MYRKRDSEKEAIARINRRLGLKTLRQPQRCPKCGRKSTLWHLRLMCFECFARKGKATHA